MLGVILRNENHDHRPHDQGDQPLEHPTDGLAVCPSYGLNRGKTSRLSIIIPIMSIDVSAIGVFKQKM